MPTRLGTVVALCEEALFPQHARGDGEHDDDDRRDEETSRDARRARKVVLRAARSAACVRAARAAPVRRSVLWPRGARERPPHDRLRIR